MQMVSPTQITKLAEKYHVNGSARVIQFASSCYDKGMAEVLEEVARKELNHHYEPKEPTDDVKDAEAQVFNQYHLLEKTLTEEQKELLRIYDEAYQTLNAIETGEEFIQGFVHGYRYIKQETAHGVSVR